MADAVTVDIERRAGAHPQRALIVEKVNERLNIIHRQRKHGLIDQRHTYFSVRHRVACFIGNRQGIGHGVAGHDRVRRRYDLNRQRLGRGVNVELDIADAHSRGRVARIDTLDDDHTDKDIRDMFHGNRDRQGFTVAGQADHSRIEHPTALQRHQRLHRGGEGARNQDLGGITRCIELFIGNQVDAVVVCARPGDKAVTADPDKNKAADRIAGVIFTGRHNLILATPFRRPGE